MTFDDVQVMRRFGTNIQSHCTIHMDDLKVKLGDEQRKDANTFFEVFLEDSNKELIDIPVMITNWDSGKKQVDDISRVYPNRAHDNIIDEWRMVRRFFTVDTISGIKDQKTDPTYVRWASEFEFKI